MPSTNTASRGTLDGEQGKAKVRGNKRPPLFASDEKATEHDSVYATDGTTEGATGDKPRIPYVFELLLPLSVCIAGALVASAYGIRWLMMVSCIIAGIATILYFVNSRRRARYRSLSDAENMEQQIADYRRDLMKTLEGYDVDRGMTAAEIDALVDEYRHHLEVENASLANVSVTKVITSLFSRKGKDKDGKKVKRGKGRGKDKKTDEGRGGLSDE